MIWFPVTIESQTGKFIFYTVAYIIFFTVATVSYIPYAVLSAEMTKDFSERNKLNSARLMFSFVATLLGGLLAQPIIDHFNGSAHGFRSILKHGNFLKMKPKKNQHSRL